MGIPVGKSGDLLVYTDSSGKKTAKPIVGLLSSRHTANGSPVLQSSDTVRLTDGRTVVLGADLGSRFTINGNPVKDPHSRGGSINGDLGGKYGVAR
jgi:hypothetical protein